MECEFEAWYEGVRQSPKGMFIVSFGVASSEVETLMPLMKTLLGMALTIHVEPSLDRENINDELAEILGLEP